MLQDGGFLVERQGLLASKEVTWSRNSRSGSDVAAGSWAGRGAGGSCRLESACSGIGPEIASVDVELGRHC